MLREERRKHPRIDALNLLSYLVIDQKGQVVTQGVGRTLNVSEGGVLLETHIPLNPDHKVSLFVALENDLIDVSGTIVYCKVSEEAKYHTGIAFENPDEASRKILERFIRAFSIWGDYADINLAMMVVLLDELRILREACDPNRLYFRKE